jgi:hypothetical protein
LQPASASKDNINKETGRIARILGAPEKTVGRLRRQGRAARSVLKSGMSNMGAGNGGALGASLPRRPWRMAWTTRSLRKGWPGRREWFDSLSVIVPERGFLAILFRVIGVFVKQQVAKIQNCALQQLLERRRQKGRASLAQRD